MPGNAKSGRKRNSYITEALVIEMKTREADGDKRGIRALAIKVWDLAESGEKWAAEYIRDTVDGKPMQQVDLTGEVDSRLTVQIIKLADAQKVDNK